MALRVLVVDDSSFFRRRVSEILNSDSDLEVIDVAVNGKEAIEKTLSLKPDVITMDVEMPVMDGITSVKRIMEQLATPILMFSSLTHKGAKATLDALEAGAIDFLPKKFEDIARDKNEASETLRQRVKTVARSMTGMRRSTLRTQTSERPRFSTSSSVSSAHKSSSFSTRERSFSSTTSNTNRTSIKAPPKVTSGVTTPARSTAAPTRSGSSSYKLLAIGTSTGGPVALQTILTALPADFPLPILLIQHMPATFTSAFASRLDSLSKIQVKEAENGDLLVPGRAYLAPGGQQMILEGSASSMRLKVIEDDSPRITYKPSVDITFGSSAKTLRDQVLAVVLTGMGADGREGARLLKQFGSTVWAQDEESCVVYGMPQAISAAGLADDEMALNDFSGRIVKEVTS